MGTTAERNRSRGGFPHDDFGFSMPELDITAGGEEDGKKMMERSHKAIVSRFCKKEVGGTFFNTANKNYVLENTT